MEVREKPTVIAPEDRPAGIKFEKIWNRAKDCDVAAVLLHANVNGLLCIDGTHALTADEVIDCCKHGCIIEANGVYYRPVFWAVKGDVAGVRCMGGTTEAPTYLTFTSFQVS